MMHKEIKQALETLGIPVSFQEYEGTEETYITFFQYNETSSLNANNQEIGTNYFFQINIHSHVDYMNVLKQVKDLMNGLGGIRQNERELYLDTWYQRVIRYKFPRIVQ